MLDLINWDYRFRYHERVSSNLDDVVILLHHSITVQSTGDVKLAEEGIKCLQVSFPSLASIPPDNVDDL